MIELRLAAIFVLRIHKITFTLLCFDYVTLMISEIFFPSLSIQKLTTSLSTGLSCCNLTGRCREYILSWIDTLLLGTIGGYRSLLMLGFTLVDLNLFAIGVVNLLFFDWDITLSVGSLVFLLSSVLAFNVQTYSVLLNKIVSPIGRIFNIFDRYILTLVT